MKRVLILLSVCLAAFSAHAEDWQLLQEAEKGVRMLVDIDSISNGRILIGDEQVPAVGAKFRYVDTDGSKTSPFIFVTPISSCKGMNGELQQGSFKDDKWVIEKK